MIQKVSYLVLSRINVRVDNEADERLLLRREPFHNSTIWGNYPFL